MEVILEMKNEVKRFIKETVNEVESRLQKLCLTKKFCRLVSDEDLFIEISLYRKGGEIQFPSEMEKNEKKVLSHIAENFCKPNLYLEVKICNVHFFEKDLGLCSFDVEMLLTKALSSMVKSNGFNYEIFENPEGYSKTIDVSIPRGMFTDKF